MTNKKITKQNHDLRTLLWAGVASLPLILGTQSAFAQAAPSAPSAPTPQRAVEEVVVTAQKRTENLRDVPISITAISAAELEARGIKNVEGIQFGTPNVVTYSDDSFNPNIIIRGISSASRNIGFESTLGIYVDGVYQGRNNSLFQDLDDVERLEVLRGPQGTLFGKNTTAGAINITTRQPSNEFEGAVGAEYGNFNAFRLNGSVSGPIVADKVYGKLSGFRTKADGAMRNLSGIGPSRFHGDDSYGARGALRFDISETFELTLRADWSSSKEDTIEDEVSSVVSNPFGIPDDSVQRGARTISINRPGTTTTKLAGVSATADWTLGEHILTSITAYRTLDSAVRQLDNDNTSIDYLYQNFDDRTKQFTQEVHLTSPKTGRLKYVLGAYYYNQTSDSDRSTVVGDPLRAILTSPGVYSALVGFPGAPDLPRALFSRPDIFTFTGVKTEALAAFANGSFELTDRLSLLGGFRVTQETKSLTLRQLVPDLLSVPGLFNAAGLPFYLNLPTTKDRIKQTEFSPSFGLQYKVSERANLYGRWSKGFKSGGWNAELLAPNTTIAPRFFNIAGIRFRPESVQNLEIGFKGDAFDRRLRFGAAAFTTEYKDIQRSRFVGGLVGYRTENANARINGFELELNARPTDRLTLSSNLGFTDAKYIKSASPDNCGNTCIPGTRLVAPRWTVGLGAGYEMPLSDTSRLAFRLDYAYRSDDGGAGLPKSPDPTVETRENTNTPAFSVVDGRIAYSTDSGIEIAFWGKNLLDEDYLIDRALESNNALLGVTHTGTRYGPPRTYGVSAVYKF
jgi:iron complex outermembrane recepter protein